MAAADQGSSFFKVLIGEFSQHLKLPTAFVGSFKGTPPPSCKCVLGVLPSGKKKTWNVKLEQDENGSLYFRGEGWHKFVKDHCLEEGDFLVFYYYSGRQIKFHVKIYDESACELDQEVSKRRRLAVETSSGKHVEMTTPTETMVFKSKYSCFMKTFEYFRMYHLMIPKKIVMAEGLLEHKFLELQSPADKKSSVIFGTGMTADGRYKITGGWHQWCKENKLSSGDKLVVEFVRPGVIRVHVFRGTDVLLLQGPKVVDEYNYRK